MGTTFTIDVADCNTEKPTWTGGERIYQHKPPQRECVGPALLCSKDTIVVTQLKAEDADNYPGSDELVYEVDECAEVPVFVNAEKIYKMRCPFQVSRTGVVTTYDLDFDRIAKAFPDVAGRFAVHPSLGRNFRTLTVRVKVRDTDGDDDKCRSTAALVSTKQFDVHLTLENINDEAPQALASYQFSVDELDEAPDPGKSSTSILQSTDSLAFNVTDADSSGGSCYGKIYFTKGDNWPQMFKLDPDSGAITVENRNTGYLQYAKAPLDLGQGKRGYELYVYAADYPRTSHKPTSDGCRADTTTEIAKIKVTITVNDVDNEPPVFEETKYEVDILGSKKTGSDVISVRATDADEKDTPASEIEYTITTVSPDGVYLAITKDGGEVTLIKEIDFDTMGADKTIRAVITAKDTKHAPTVDLIIHVKDVNDNKPVFINPKAGAMKDNKLINALQIPEGQPNYGFTFAAKDADSGENGRILYSMVITNQQGSGPFTMNRVTGRFEQVKALDYENKNERKYEIKITATDYGTPASMSTVTIPIEIQGRKD